MTETPDPTTTLAAWRAKAEKQAAGYTRMHELGGGIGMLGVREPEMYDDMSDWQDSTENDHADTVLGLLGFAEAVLALADEWEAGGEPSPDWWYARGLRAALAEHLGGEGL